MASIVRARGIRNTGNSCYVNSVLQALAAFPTFSQYLEFRAKELSNHNNLVLSLRDTLNELQRDGKPFIQRISDNEPFSRHFVRGVQQDAHEFLTLLLDVIASPIKGSEKEYLRAARNLGLPSTDSPKRNYISRFAFGTSLRRNSLAHMLYDYASPSKFPNSTTSPSSTPTSTPSTPSEDGTLTTSSSSASSSMSSFAIPLFHNGGYNTGASSFFNDTFGSSSSGYSTPLPLSSSSSSLPSTPTGRRRPNFKVMPFMGKMESTLTCTKSKLTWSTIQPMTILSAYIPANSSCTLEDCIQGSTRTETISDFLCQKCHNKHKMQKTFVISKCPEILCIFINRLKYRNRTTLEKLGAHVEFDLELNLPTAANSSSGAAASSSSSSQPSSSSSSFSNSYSHINSHSSTSNGNHQADNSFPNGFGNLNGSSSSISSSSHNNLEDLDNIDNTYSLVSVIVHLGSSYGGHYVCYRASDTENPGDDWVYISDTVTKSIPFREVKKQEAYMLFYKKKTYGMETSRISRDFFEDSASTASTATAVIFSGL